MGDLSDDSVNTLTQLTGQSADILKALLEFLANRNQKAMQAQSMTRETGSNKRGKVSVEKLYDSGEPLTPIGVPMNKEDLKKFNKYAKSCGMQYTTIANAKVINQIKDIKKELKEIEKENKLNKGLSSEMWQRKQALEKQLESLESQKHDVIIVIKAKDIFLAQHVIDCVNRDNLLEEIEEELEDINDKGEKATEEDKKREEELNDEKEEILNEEVEEFNNKSNEAILNNTEETLDVDTAIEQVSVIAERDNLTEPYYICSRTQPDNYIEVTADSVNRDHWNLQENEAAEAGKDVLVFRNAAEYMKYKEEFAKSAEKMATREDNIFVEADANSYTDYMGIVNNLQAQLSDHNLALNERMEVCRSGSKEVVHLEQLVSDDEKMDYLATANIAEQVKAYKELNNIQNKKAMIQESAEELSADNKELLSSLSEREVALKGKVKGLENDAKALVSVAVMHELQEAKVSEQKQGATKQDERNHEESVVGRQNEQVIDGQEHAHGSRQQDAKGTQRKESFRQSMSQWEKAVNQNRADRVSKPMEKMAQKSMNKSADLARA